MFLFKDDQTDDYDYDAQRYDQGITVFQTGHIFEIHPKPAGDQCQREEDGGYYSQELHIAVLPCVCLRLAGILYLLGILQEMPRPAHQPVRPVGQSPEVFQVLL